ncbi:hypothetical protein [Streptomyces halobius]|uniref:Uncharacterized protein n=1 Tax=Streptomyces halobius TaxID=2879846 RepID=A0ABY4MJ43_9ACTN|nr:hypothetical protein [Streptomyces halobius]UQA97372.1 hypothetical protein K9S39_40860 [Streptomyces halobius]
MAVTETFSTFSASQTHDHNAQSHSATPHADGHDGTSCKIITSGESAHHPSPAEGSSAALPGWLCPTAVPGGIAIMPPRPPPQPSPAVLSVLRI